MTVPRRRPPSDAATAEGQVPFHDVDPLLIVWHGHYFKYLEIARTELFRRHGIDGQELLDLGYRFVIAHSECRHVAPLTYGDRWRASAWFLDVEHRVHVGYEIWDLTHDRRAARARTELVTMDDERRLLLETPKVILDRIRAPLPASEGA